MIGKKLRAYEITEEGLVVGAALARYRGILTGNAEPTRPPVSMKGEAEGST